MINNEITKRYTNLTDESLGCMDIKNFYSLDKDMNILDIGCGSGKTLIYIHDKLEGDCNLFGLDVTDGMLEKANTNRGIRNINFIKAEMQNLPFESNFFDMVTSNCAVNHAKDKTKVYSEIFRVLRPGGYFIIGDIATKEPLPKEISESPEWVAQCLGGALQKEIYLQIIRDTGFKKLDLLNQREYIKEGFKLYGLTIKGVK